MSFSWFFGSKKKHSEQEEATTAESQNDKMDNFIFVERRVEEDAPTGMYPPLPYALLAPQTNASGPSKSTSAAVASGTSTNFLHEVPFTLVKDASMQVLSTLKQDMNMVKSIQAYINFLDPNDFDYDFRMERGVLNENSPES